MLWCRQVAWPTRASGRAFHPQYHRRECLWTHEPSPSQRLPSRSWALLQTSLGWTSPSCVTPSQISRRSPREPERVIWKHHAPGRNDKSDLSWVTCYRVFTLQPCTSVPFSPDRRVSKVSRHLRRQRGSSSGRGATVWALPSLAPSPTRAHGKRCCKKCWAVSVNCRLRINSDSNPTCTHPMWSILTLWPTPWVGRQCWLQATSKPFLWTPLSGASSCSRWKKHRHCQEIWVTLSKLRDSWGFYLRRSTQVYRWHFLFWKRVKTASSRLLTLKVPKGEMFGMKVLNFWGGQLFVYSQLLFYFSQISH